MVQTNKKYKWAPPQEAHKSSEAGYQKNKKLKTNFS